MNTNFGRLVFFLLATTCISVISTASIAEDLVLDSLDGLRLNKVSAGVVDHDGHRAIHVSDAGEGLAGNNEDKLVILDDLQFEEGVIEIKLAGAPGAHAGENARGFVGMAFHVAEDVSTFEAFYLRPTNGRADDQLRRNHSAQYFAFPEYPWHRLREEAPGMYETYIDLVPGEWTDVKIEVAGGKARLFVHGNEQPSLIVNDLKLGERSGRIGLWIGPGTDAWFSNLRVTAH